MRAEIVYLVSWAVSTLLGLEVEVFGQEARDALRICVEWGFRRALADFLVLVVVSTVGANLAILEGKVEELVVGAGSASIHDKQRLVVRASSALLILGVVHVVLLAVFAGLIGVIEELRQEAADAGYVGLEGISCRANALLNLGIELLPLEAAHALLHLEVEVLGWGAGDALHLIDLVGEVVLAFTLIIQDVILSSFIAVFAFLVCFIPVGFSRADVASVAVVEGVGGRAGLALASVQVIGLVISAGFAGESGEIEEVRVGTENTCFVIPKIGLIFKAVALLSSSIVLSSLTADEAQFLSFAVEVSLLALIAFIIVLELFVGRASARQALSIEDTSSGAGLA